MNININNHCGITSETLHGAMDQHAMNIAILFAEFIEKNSYIYYSHTGEWTRLTKEFISEYVCDTTTELYQIFLNQLKNGNNKDSTLPRPDAEKV